MQPDTSAAKAGSLPVELTAFIGRERELAALRQLASSSRLLTLTGAGGSGKSRLAAELAGRLTEIAPDGIIWIELGPLTDGTLIPGEIVRALDPGAEAAGAEAVTRLLRERAALLVLDNCEHLVDACATLADALLQACPGLRILATSREALGVPGERAWLVPPLALPAPDTPTAELERYDAVRLFVDRARDVVPDFAITPQNAAAIAAVCERLDGIPLAIQLAAARVRVMAPEQIRDRLSDAFALLTSPARTVVPRHRTLRAAIDWSYELLAADARAVLRRLSVFRGGFTLDGAEWVSALSGESTDVLDGVAGLVDRSLLLMREREGAARYYLLEIVRQYAARHLLESGEEHTIRQRLAAWITDLVAVAEPTFTTPARLAACARLETELDNIREVLLWTKQEEPERYVRLVGMLWWFWYSTRHWTEARRWIDDALTLPEGQRPDRLRAAVLFASGALYALQAKVEPARPVLEEAISLAAAAGDGQLAAYARNYLGMTYAGVGAREAIVHSGQAAEWFREHGDLYGLRLALLLVGIAEAENGNVVRAEELMREAVSVARQFGRDRELAIALQTLAVQLVDLGRMEEAERLLLEALQLLGRDSSYLFLGRALEFLGAITAGRDPVQAVRYLGAGDALRRHVGANRFQLDQQRIDALLPTLRSRLGLEAYDRAFAEGVARPVVELLEGVVVRPVAPAPAVAPAPTVPAKPAAVPTPAAAVDLRVQVLGPYQVWVRGQLVERWPYAKPKELLAYLLTHPRGRTRTEIAGAIWPDATPAQLRNNFHVTLHHLRKLLGQPDWIVLEEERYRVAAGITSHFDAAAFETRVRSLLAPARATENQTASLRAALALYQGHFLAAEPAGTWRDEEQDRLRRFYCDGALRLGALLDEAGDGAGALAVYEAAVAHEPLLEEAHRRLLAGWARAGDRVRALRHYDRLVAQLRDQLQLEPEPETVELSHRIRQAPA